MYILPFEGLNVYENLAYEEVLVVILDQQMKSLTSKEESSVKVLWRNHFVEVSTWVKQDDMKSNYPYTFTYPPMKT